MNSFADWMLSDYCQRLLVVDEIIMNQPVIQSEERSIVVSRKGTPLKSGDFYIPGELLEVALKEGQRSGAQHVFEVTGTGALFDRGGCESKRSTKEKSTLIISATTTDTIHITAGSSSTSVSYPSAVTHR